LWTRASSTASLVYCRFTACSNGRNNRKQQAVGFCRFMYASSFWTTLRLFKAHSTSNSSGSCSFHAPSGTYSPADKLLGMSFVEYRVHFSPHKYNRLGLPFSTSTVAAAVLHWLLSNERHVNSATTKTATTA
jgi:hypothetical protein